MVLIFILAADTRCAVQGASIQGAIQLSNAVGAGSHTGRGWDVCCCAARCKDEERGKKGGNPSSAVTP